MTNTPDTTPAPPGARTEYLLGLFSGAMQTMAAEEARPAHVRDPRPAVRVAGMGEVLQVVLRSAGVRVDAPDYPLNPQAVLDALLALRVADTSRDPVHVSHCCPRHGCKYGDIGCPVTGRRRQARYGCEECDDAEEDDLGSDEI